MNATYDTNKILSWKWRRQLLRPLTSLTETREALQPVKKFNLIPNTCFILSRELPTGFDPLLSQH